MFFFNPKSAFGSLSRILRRSVFTLTVLFCLSSALLIGCKMDDDDKFVDDHKLNNKLIGTWADTNSGDSYIITGDHLTYQFGTTINYAGTIEYVSNFSDSAGVIIIKYDAEHRSIYYADDHYGDPDYILDLKGDYLGVYFKELTPGSVQIGGVYAAGGAEEATLNDAKAAFTSGNEGDYMSWYGTYTK